MTVLAKDGDAFVLTYDLLSLPTAQHKAGLSGLLLMIDSLKERKVAEIPVIESVSAAGARIAFTRPALDAVFNDLYDSSRQEVEVKNKWSGKEPKRTVEVEAQVDGKVKKEKRFVYDATIPAGAFFKHLIPDAGDIYIKLWRDMLWSTLRGIPKTRLVYEERAKGLPSSLSADFWSGFEKTLAFAKKGKIPTEGISSSIFVGAEDCNAEKVPFSGSITENFLLQFWPIVSLIYVPRTMEIERNKEQGLRVSRSEAGFVLSIPEPAELDWFREDVRAVLKRLEPEKRGIRPRAALIDVHEEGGLDHLYNFAKNKTRKLGEFECSVCAIELFHLQKHGNRIRQLAAGRILPDENVLKDYESTREAMQNPVFKSILLRNMVDGKDWYFHFDSPFQRYPMPMFILCRGRTPVELRFFGLDARRKFRAIGIQLETDLKGGIMDEKVAQNQLSMRIYRLIQTYVNFRTEEKSGRKYVEFSKQKGADGHIPYPPEYRESREKVCSDAFLAMRGRRDQDFVEYFTGTVCSVPQYLNQEDYITVAGALISDWEKIKVLSMLALSAHSYLPGNSESKEVE